MSKSKIEWTEATWNPVTGCAKVSAGCKNCYAEREWIRLSANPQTVYFQRNFNDVMCHHERLEQPIRWRKPRRIFVNSMSDLFHDDIPDSFIDSVFAVMAYCHEHTFQILTKRPERMQRYVADMYRRSLDIAQASMWVLDGKYWNDADDVHNYVQHRIENGLLQNVWLGVSVEDQTTANERIPLLLQTPAAVRWISAEPLLAPIDFVKTGALGCNCDSEERCYGSCQFYKNSLEKHRISWIVVGGESGHKARPMHPDWVRSIRDQCKEAGVPFLFKQWGEWAIDQLHAGGDLGGDLKRGIVQHLCLDRENDGHFRKGDVHMRRVGKRTAGRLLDSVLHDEYPEEYQYPEVYQND